MAPCDENPNTPHGSRVVVWALPTSDRKANNGTLCNKNVPIICQPVIWHVCWRELSKGSKAGGILWLESWVVLDVFLMFSHFQSQNFWVLTWEATLFSERQQIFFRPFVSLNAGAILVCTSVRRRCINLYFVASARVRYSGTSGNGCYMSQACQRLDMYRLYRHVSPFHRFRPGPRSRRQIDLATLTFSEFSQKW